MIPVTKPFLPPQEAYQHYLNGIWQRQWLTNMGPLANELEEKLQQHLHTSLSPLFVTNGTIALQMAIKALDLSGEIITTPFSFVATTSSIVWEGCTPVFVDIEEQSLNIDPAKIEAAISPRTTAILATHVYGNPCDVQAIEDIAQRHQLKVIYDGAHAFGVQVNGRSIFDYGNISTCSLHATKLYHSGEGGLVVCRNPELQQKLKYMRNFGFSGPESFASLGINGKNSEFHAAMGLTNLPYIDAIHEKRKQLTEAYDSGLSSMPLLKPVWHKEANLNYAYYPLIFENEEQMLSCRNSLAEKSIQTRRYFYPSLANTLPYVPAKNLPATDEIASKILCLPLYYDLAVEEAQEIAETITQKIIA